MEYWISPGPTDGWAPSPTAILARTVVHADKEGPKKYWFGYSDEACFFLNGRLVFYGKSAYRSRDTSFLGIIGFYDAVSLPLKKGSNEILFAIGEASGGWGLVLQDATAVHKAAGVEALWETGRDFLIPESAAYDPASDAFYVSNYDGYNPSRGAGLQHISKLTPDGKVVALQWVSGLNNPTGLAVRNGRLYAVERAGLVEIDISSARIVNRTALPGAGFPNDVAVADNGDVYISDSRKSSIYKVSGGRAEEWLNSPDIAAPNGIHILQEKLIVGANGDGCLKTVDLATKAVSTLANLGQGTIDGLDIGPGGQPPRVPQRRTSFPGIARRPGGDDPRHDGAPDEYRRLHLRAGPEHAGFPDLHREPGRGLPAGEKSRIIRTHSVCGLFGGVIPSQGTLSLPRGTPAVFSVFYRIRSDLMGGQLNPRVVIGSHSTNADSTRISWCLS